MKAQTNNCYTSGTLGDKKELCPLVLPGLIYSFKRKDVIITEEKQRDLLKQ